MKKNISIKTAARKDGSMGIQIFSSNALKMIACMSMLADHIGLIFMNNNVVMRAIGRLAFPIFAFLLVQGLMHTSDIRKYIGRLGVFALLSELPFDLAMHDSLLYPGSQNIFFTLTLGLLAIYSFETTGPLRKWAVETAFASALAAEFLRFDYGLAGIGVILLFYWCEKEKRTECQLSGTRRFMPNSYFGLKQNIELVVVSSVMYILCLGISQLYALLALFPVNMYNGRRGKFRFKYAFYVFFPLHLLLIWIIWKNIH